MKLPRRPLLGALFFAAILIALLARFVADEASPNSANGLSFIDKPSAASASAPALPFEPLPFTSPAGDQRVPGATPSAWVPAARTVEQMVGYQEPAVLPAALIEPESGSFNATQLAALEALRAAFLVSLGGPDANPNDPAYRQRWTASQPELDEQFRALFGEEAFNAQSTEAADLTAQESRQ